MDCQGSRSTGEGVERAFLPATGSRTLIDGHVVEAHPGMNLLDRFLPRIWLLAPVLACGLLVWMASVRIARVEHIMGLAGGGEVAVDAKSPTGYTGGKRVLIVPEPNDESYQWIAQTQQMLVRREWRVRHVDYDNAPFGRDVFTPSPYRWWLGGVAWVEHLFSGRPLAAAVERAALWADPIFHLLLLIATTIATRRWFGVLPATMVAIGWAGLFPLAAVFPPAQPSAHGLGIAGVVWSVLPLLAGILGPTTAAPDPRVVRRRFVLAGVAGGLGLWVNVGVQIPIIAGVIVGALSAAFLRRRGTVAENGGSTAELPWRAWAVAGVITSVVAYGVEYLPAHWRGLRLEENHPLYALAWWGAAELLVRVTAWRREGRSAWTRRSMAMSVAAGIAVASVPVTMMFREGEEFLAMHSLGSRLSNLAGSAAAGNFLSWMTTEADSLVFWATVLPVLIVVPVAGRIFLGTVAPNVRIASAIAVATVAVAVGFATANLGWWQTVSALLLVGLVVAISDRAGPPRGKWAWTGGVAMAMATGCFLLLPKQQVRNREVLSEVEVQALIERDLAHWLATRVGPEGAVVLAPPRLTMAFYYHGGLRGIGTPHPGNRDGFVAAVRLAGASSADEAQALAKRRQMTHIVIPSWDTFMDQYARLGSSKFEESLVSMLHRWLAPRWLRPVPYQLPNVAGFEGQFAAIFQAVEVQDNATALSRLAEYFVEMNQLPGAAAVMQTLEQAFPDDLDALVARAQVAIARRDSATFTRLIESVRAALARGQGESLLWDRRVSLAFVLVQAVKDQPSARKELQRCLAEIDETNLRSLTTTALGRFRIMLRRFELEIEPPELRDLARTLLPAEIREQP
jgi:hypothetical protein